VSRLIVNADDFGLTPGVNRAIVELHAAGVLSSATLMARAAATDEAVELARSTPTLGVGCHVVLVDGESALEPNQIPSLIDPRTGGFYPTLGTFLPRLLSGRIRAAEIEAEAHAQIASLQANGISLTHIDTHKHAHMFAAVLRPVLCAARSCGIRALRNPFEPAWAVRAAASAPWIRRSEVRLLHWLEPAFRRIAAEAGFTTSNGALGIAATGTLDADAIRKLVQKLPAGTWELVSHPGYNDADLARVRTRLRASRENERAALAALKNFSDLEIISYAKLKS
jgi:hopanoid biosynthesis associated protein HpnK